MARPKTRAADNKRARDRKHRLTWTRFRLPKEQDWPRWNIDDTDNLGPLAELPGCYKVFLGRLVEDSEQAVLIIFWRSIEDLEQFELTDNFRHFLFCLGYEEPTLPSKLLTLQWDCGFDLYFKLYGRMTLTKLDIPGEEGVVQEGGRGSRNGTVYEAVPVSAPTKYEDPREIPPEESWRYVNCFIPPFPRVSYTWVDNRSCAAPPEEEESAKSRSVCYVFWRWALTGDREQEQILAQDPETKEYWAQAVAKVVPPVQTWEQERWEIRIAPSYGPNWDELSEYENHWPVGHEEWANAPEERKQRRETLSKLEDEAEAA